MKRTDVEPNKPPIRLDYTNQYAASTSNLQNTPRRCFGLAEFAGLKNDGVEQEQTYILHTMK